MADYSSAAGFGSGKQAFARERITVDNSVKSLTADTYNNAAAAVDLRQRACCAKIVVETASIRFTEEGTDPNNGVGTEVGTLAGIGDVIYLNGYNALAKFKAIRSASAGTSGVIEVVYYR